MPEYTWKAGVLEYAANLNTELQAFETDGWEVFSVTPVVLAGGMAWCVVLRQAYEPT